MRVACALGLFLAVLQLGSSLLLGAFNIQHFGKKKSEDTRVMDIISQIVHRYDIVLIQEVLDNDLSATKRLMERVNSAGLQFAYIVSEPLGPSTYKERYLFLYRMQRVTVQHSYTYANKEQKFQRPPFIVMFGLLDKKETCEEDQLRVSCSMPMEIFTLIPQHTRPADAVKELDALYDVVHDVRTHWKTNNIILLGDFNAGCAYVRPEQWKEIRLRQDPDFHWLIPDTAVTAVATRCPYDRIVATANMLATKVVHGSATVYNFEKDLHLKQKEVKAVSDHFPVVEAATKEDYRRSRRTGRVSLMHKSMGGKWRRAATSETCKWVEPSGTACEQT